MMDSPHAQLGLMPKYGIAGAMGLACSQPPQLLRSYCQDVLFTRRSPSGHSSNIAESCDSWLTLASHSP